MSKLPKQYQFFDLSDYGRYVARKIASALKDTAVTPVQVTYWFIIAGLLAIISIYSHHHYAAGFFLIAKSTLDAADGELARLKKTPSYVGRYLDSIADILLNFMFLFTFWIISPYPISYMLMAFIGVQLQGTLYNYYYVILRHKVNGDTTSRIFEDFPPKAMKGENQKTVDRYFKLFNLLYRPFDKAIYLLDKNAINSPPFPKWFMTWVSMLGLGSQLLIMSIMLVLNLEQYVIPFFICYSVMIIIFVGIRRLFLV